MDSALTQGDCVPLRKNQWRRTRIHSFRVRNLTFRETNQHLIRWFVPQSSRTFSCNSSRDDVTLFRPSSYLMKSRNDQRRRTLGAMGRRRGNDSQLRGLHFMKMWRAEAKANPEPRWFIGKVDQDPIQIQSRSNHVLHATTCPRPNVVPPHTSGLPFEPLSLTMAGIQSALVGPPIQLRIIFPTAQADCPNNTGAF